MDKVLNKFKAAEYLILGRIKKLTNDGLFGKSMSSEITIIR